MRRFWTVIIVLLGSSLAKTDSLYLGGSLDYLPFGFFSDYHIGWQNDVFGMRGSVKLYGTGGNYSAGIYARLKELGSQTGGYLGLRTDLLAQGANYTWTLQPLFGYERRFEGWWGLYAEFSPAVLTFQSGSSPPCDMCGFFGLIRIFRINFGVRIHLNY